MKTCESYFVNEEEPQSKYQNENVTDMHSSKERGSSADNHLRTPSNRVPESENAGMNEVTSNDRRPVTCDETLLSSPSNQTTSLATNIIQKKKIEMSDSTSIKEEENTSDDIENLLSMKVSKDYINCVWTNEPQNSKTSNIRSSPEKLVIPDATASSEEANSTIPPDEKEPKVLDKINSKPPKRKKKALRSKEDTAALVQKINMKAKDKLSKQLVSAPLLSHSNSSKPKMSSESQETAKEISDKNKKTDSLKLSKISQKLLTLPTFKRFDTPNSSLSVAYKNLIVKRSIPLYKPTQYDVRFFKGSYFDCKACGDRFILETSLTCHMRRKTSRFSYKCPVCKISLVFDNRCCLLLHIMSHGMDARNLHAEDLLYLPMTENESECDAVFKHTSSNSYKCPECFGPVSSLKSHFQGFESVDYTSTTRAANSDLCFKCKQCTYILPTKCSLSAHERFHMMKPPHLCPDCGEVFLSSLILYNHMKDECLHHLKCSIFECGDCKVDVTSLHTFTEHLVEKHLQTFFVCHICGDKIDSFIQFNEHRLSKHKLPAVAQNSETAGLCARVECDKCPDLNISIDLLQDHAASHATDPKFMKTVYQCEICKLILTSETLVRSHKIDCKGTCEENCGAINKRRGSPDLLVHAATSLTPSVPTEVSDSEQISPGKPVSASLPGNSSLEIGIDINQKNHEKSGCTKVNPLLNGFQDILVPDLGFSTTPENPEKKAICKLCREVVSDKDDKAALKKHFSTQHLDIFLNAVHQEDNNRLSLQTVSTRSKEAVSEFDKRAVENLLICIKNDDFTKAEKKMLVKKKAAKGFNVRKSSFAGRTSQKKVSRFDCYKCLFQSEDSESFNTHILSHKSNPSDLQCPQCGLCFIVRPPLEKHLIVGHGIKNVNKYLIDHGFQDRTSDGEEDPVDVETLEPEELQENQCTVCRQNFESALMLQKHFRVHGGAFLLAKLKARQSSQ